MENKEKYFQFPLFLMRGLFIDKEKALNDIISFGIYHYSKMVYDIEDVAKQLMYGYYRSGLRNDLSVLTQEYINDKKLELDEDYNGFSGSEFHAEYEVPQLLELFENDTDFKEKAIEFYQIKQAYDFLGLEWNPNKSLKAGKAIEKKIAVKEPFPNISKSLVFDFRDNEKSEFDLIQFAAYISIRSILGRKAYCKTNKKMIISRMFGYKSNKDLPAEMDPAIKDLFTKYSNRYHIDKVLMFLELNWNIITYSRNIRGLYVGNGNKVSIDNLALIAETKKKKGRIENLKKAKIEAREKALQQLNKVPHLNK